MERKLLFGDIRKMDYDDVLPFEYVLVDMLYKKVINVNFVLSCYADAIEKEKHLNEMRFEEACLNLTQLLSKNFKGKYRDEIIKRAIHTFNLTKTLIPHVHDDTYGYTGVDEKQWDELCKTIYGTNLKK